MKRTITLLISFALLFSVITLSGCSKTVSEYDLNVNYNDTTYVGKFSGTIKKNIPANETKGKFVSGQEGTGKYLEYDGEWKDGVFFGKGKLKQESFSVKYNEDTISGVFDGETLNGIPNGNGTFIADNKDDLVFEYEGNWDNGQISGKGKLKYNKYVVEFSDGIVRTGTFEGEVVNCKPEGNGSYTTANDDNEKYTYTGEFANGKFNGHGKKSFENGKHGIQDGNWKDNEFYPTLVERIQDLGTYKDDCEYSLNDEQKSFIEKNENAFIKHSYDKNLLNEKFDLKSFKKNPSNYKPSLVKITGLRVIQISEYEGFGNTTITNMLACDSNFENYYYIYKLDRTKGVVEDSTVQMVFMPLGYSTYETTSGGTNWAVSGFAVDIIK